MYLRTHVSSLRRVAYSDILNPTLTDRLFNECYIVCVFQGVLIMAKSIHLEKRTFQQLMAVTYVLVKLTVPSGAQTFLVVRKYS